MGTFRADNVSAEQLGLMSRGAVALTERNGWNKHASSERASGWTDPIAASVTAWP